MHNEHVNDEEIYATKMKEVKDRETESRLRKPLANQFFPHRKPPNMHCRTFEYVHARSWLRVCWLFRAFSTRQKFTN
jgi:hypothetical protein